ncbi:MAG: hypothetical protein Q9212_006418 [Teloschistes hypoglaucus]
MSPNKVMLVNFLPRILSQELNGGPQEAADKAGEPRCTISLTAHFNEKGGRTPTAVLEKCHCRMPAFHYIELHTIREIAQPLMLREQRYEAVDMIRRRDIRFALFMVKLMKLETKKILEKEVEITKRRMHAVECCGRLDAYGPISRQTHLFLKHTPRLVQEYIDEIGAGSAGLLTELEATIGFFLPKHNAGPEWQHMKHYCRVPPNPAGLGLLDIPDCCRWTKEEGFLDIPEHDVLQTKARAINRRLMHVTVGILDHLQQARQETLKVHIVECEELLRIQKPLSKKLSDWVVHLRTDAGKAELLRTCRILIEGFTYVPPAVDSEEGTAKLLKSPSLNSGQTSPFSDLLKMTSDLGADLAKILKKHRQDDFMDPYGGRAERSFYHDDNCQKAAESLRQINQDITSELTRMEEVLGPEGRHHALAAYIDRYRRDVKPPAGPDDHSFAWTSAFLSQIDMAFAEVLHPNTDDPKRQLLGKRHTMRINNTCRHTLWEHLHGGVQDIASSANPRSFVGRIVDLPNRNHCPPPCHKRGISRIVLVEKTSANGDIHLEPMMHGCTCQPAWRKQHQRQLVRAGHRNEERLTKEVITLSKALEDMLARHREIFKTDLNQEKYWLRQQYARMISAKAQKNRKLHMDAEKDRRIVKGTGEKEGTQDRIEFMQVDRDHHWVDPKLSEFLDDEDLDALANFEAINTEKVLSRLEDLKRRAAATMRDWAAEDAGLVNLMGAGSPGPEPTDDRFSDFSTFPVGGGPDEKAEVLRCDMWANLRQAVVSDRILEISEVLLEIRRHLSKQMSETEAAQGGEGRRRALFSYLKRYEDGLDLQLPERVPASADTTWIILAKAKAMIEGWEGKEVATKGRFEDTVTNQ